MHDLASKSTCEGLEVLLFTNSNFRKVVSRSTKLKSWTAIFNLLFAEFYATF